MKKLLYVGVLSALLLAACGDDVTTIKDTDSDTTKTNEEAKTNTSAPVEKEEVVEENETESNVDENDEMRAENTYTNKELGITGEVGPMKYNIPAVQLKKITIKSESAATLFDANIGDEVHGITIAFDGENTSDEDVTFYLSQATIITNTKEQLDPEMFLSEYIESEYLGQVAHEGHNFYVLKKSKVDELETIEVRISAPINSNWDSLGEDIKHVIEVNK